MSMCVEEEVLWNGIKTCKACKCMLMRHNISLQDVLLFDDFNDLHELIVTMDEYQILSINDRNAFISNVLEYKRNINKTKMYHSIVNDIHLQRQRISNHVNNQFNVLHNDLRAQQTKILKKLDKVVIQKYKNVSKQRDQLTTKLQHNSWMEYYKITNDDLDLNGLNKQINDLKLTNKNEPKNENQNSVNKCQLRQNAAINSSNAGQQNAGQQNTAQQNNINHNHTNTNTRQQNNGTHITPTIQNNGYTTPNNGYTRQNNNYSSNNWMEYYNCEHSVIKLRKMLDDMPPYLIYDLLTHFKVKFFIYYIYVFSEYKYNAN